jgi:hypothetical protein
MQQWLVLIFALVAANSIRAEPDRLELVWSDEFDGNSLDASKWEAIVSGRGGGNKELQYYRKENVRVADGMLVI